MPTFSAATFRTIGNAATTQNIFSIFNSGTNKVVRIRRLVMQIDATAVLTGVMPIFKTSRITTNTGGGQPLTKVAWDTAAQASHADILTRQSTTGDGVALTALTGTPGDILWQQYGMRLHSAVGQVLALDNNMLPAILESYPVILRQNEGLVVHLLASAAASNPATNHYFVQCVWEEDNS